jgi:hypothetical protein
VGSFHPAVFGPVVAGVPSILESLQNPLHLKHHTKCKLYADKLLIFNFLQDGLFLFPGALCNVLRCLFKLLPILVPSNSLRFQFSHSGLIPDFA